MRVLLIGGGKSGKSSTAQRLAAALSGDAPRYYWATMTPHDAEDRLRIRRHVHAFAYTHRHAFCVFQFFSQFA